MHMAVQELCSRLGIRPADEEEELCVATLSDFQSVLDIEPGYYGLDYLPTTYESLVQGPGVSGYVYKIGGKVVGFLSITLVDGGQTLVTNAARVHVTWRDKKVYGRFNQKVLQQYQNIPGVKYNTFTTDNVNLEANGQKLLRTHKLIEDKMITITEMNVDALKSKALEPALGEISGLREMTLDELYNLMTTDPGNVNHLFPQGRIILEWKPFRVMAANYPFILQGFDKTKKRIFLTSGPECTVIGNEIQNLPKLFSVTSYTDCRKGSVIRLDIFGAGSPEDLQAHVEWHLRYIAGVVSAENVVLSIFYSRSTDDVIEHLRQKYPLKDSEIPYTTMSLVERELH